MEDGKMLRSRRHDGNRVCGIGLGEAGSMKPFNQVMRI
jgi:hypothetical protein